MKKGALLLLLLLLGLIGSAQQPISMEEALQTARDFASIKSSLEHYDIQLNEVVQSPTRQRTNLFIFSLKPQGFVVVSALNRVLAYSFDDPFPMLNDAPESVAEWTESYNLTTDYYFEHPEAVRSKKAEENPRSVDALLTSRWKQGCYYNEFCPKDSAGQCNHVLAGCVAIAMAQIMYYHKQPLMGTGSNSYSQAPYGTISADFEISYRWDEMVDELTKPNPAIAELIFHCGVSTQMNYGPSLSSTSNIKAYEAFWENFSYYTASLSLRSNYSDEKWISLLKRDLDQSLPIYYSGVRTSEGGHAFVCDGYDSESRFHFNFGWGGPGNGFYDIDDPLEFSAGQQIIHSLYSINSIPVYPDTHGIYYVSADGDGDGSSWENATNQLQAVMIKAAPEEQIWVKEGFYSNNTSSSHSFLVLANCHLYGGFRGDEPYNVDLTQRHPEEYPTILDGSSSQGVIFQLDCFDDSQLVIDGFTIRNGFAEKGGGMYLIDNATIRNCIIENNCAMSSGGGIYRNGLNRLNQIENCVFRGNQALYGGGVYDNGKMSQYLNCQFSNNHGIRLGGGVWASPYGKIQFFNCLCNNNKANTGGGFYLKGGVEIYNSTIVMNQATEDCGGIYNIDITEPNKIINTIIWGNASNGSVAQIGPLLGYQYSAVQDNTTTLGHNIKLDASNDGNDPVLYVRFRNLPDAVGIAGHGGDWHLQNNSPCIDAGTTFVNIPPIDLDGNMRSQHNDPDMGVFETNTSATLLNGFFCDGAPYYFEDQEYAEEGYYTFLYPHPDHDSLLVLHLTPKESNYITLDRTLCEGNTISFSGQTIDQAGQYFWSINCINYTLNVEVTPSPSLHLTGDTIIPYGGKTRLTVTGADSYLWSTGETTSEIIVSPKEDAVYHVTGSYQNGCSEHLTINIHVIQDETLVAPNPATDQVRINAAQIQQVILYNILGEKMAAYDSASLPLLVNVSDYPPGIYVILIRCGNQEHVVKLVVTR